MLICVGRTGVIGDGSLFGTGEAVYTISPLKFSEIEMLWWMMIQEVGYTAKILVIR